MIIRNEQKDKLTQSMTKKFIFKTSLFLEKNCHIWCQDKTENMKRAFIEEMIAFARNHRVFIEINIQKLIFWKIQYDFAIPLSGYSEDRLNRAAFDEGYRIDQFFQVITTKQQLLPITLDSDI